MMDRKLKRSLEKIEIPAYDVRKLEEMIINAKKIELHPEKLRMTNMEFIIDQMRFISKKTWISKIIFSAFMMCVLVNENGDAGNWFWTFIAISGPILCLMNANEICSAFQAGLVEIQMTAKNSFRKVLIIRMVVFGLFDLIFFTCTAVIMSIFKETAIWQVILYSTVPYEIMCFGCMFILNRCREENLLLYSGTYGICLSCMIVVLKISGITIFEIYYFGVWAAIGTAAIIGIGLELRKILKKAGGNLNEINYGTAV